MLLHDLLLERVEAPHLKPAGKLSTKLRKNRTVLPLPHRGAAQFPQCFALHDAVVVGRSRGQLLLLVDLPAQRNASNATAANQTIIKSTNHLFKSWLWWASIGWRIDPPRTKHIHALRATTSLVRSFVYPSLARDKELACRILCAASHSFQATDARCNVIVRQCSSALACLAWSTST